MFKKNSHSVIEALQIAKRYCAYQERCHQDVINKLKSLNMIPEAIDHIMVQLIEEGFLNESRFAKAYVKGKFRIKHWGRNRLRAELLKRGVSKYIINEAITEIDKAEYIEIFNALAEKRLSSIKDSNVLVKKRKLADYLLYRGWEPQLVYDKVSELIS